MKLRGTYTVLQTYKIMMGHTNIYDTNYKVKIM